MAGRRRIPGAEPKPRRRDASPAKRKENANAALAKAATPADRLQAAADYTRAALYRSPDGASAERLVEELMELGDRLNGLTSERRTT